MSCHGTQNQSGCCHASQPKTGCQGAHASRHAQAHGTAGGQPAHEGCCGHDTAREHLQRYLGQLEGKAKSVRERLAQMDEQTE